MTKEKMKDYYTEVIAEQKKEIAELKEVIEELEGEMADVRREHSNSITRASNKMFDIAEALGINKDERHKVESRIYVEIGKLLEIKSDKERKFEYMGTEYVKDDEEKIEWDQYKS